MRYNVVQRAFRKLLGYRLGGSAMSPLLVPPGLNTEAYLRSYGEIGWLFGAVSLIADAVASVVWRLYRLKGKQRVEVESHPLLDLLAYVNPFQTRYEFVQLLEMYLLLAGEGYIVLNYTKGKLPGEMWLAPPQFMTPIPDATNYLSHYEYRRGMNTQRFDLDEVIHIMSPNPVDAYKGLGAAQSIGVDLDSERYAARYTQRLFYNDATPGIVIEYPDVPGADDRKQIREEWDEVHKGWRNARKAAFLWGGAKVNTVAMTNRDMDFWRLRMVNKDIILGAYHIPASLLGLETVGSRARAEADEYVFAKYSVRPALMRLREALNEQLVPQFDKMLVLDFDNPVPEDRIQVAEESRGLVGASVITREEARERLGYSSEAPAGQTYLVPFNVIAQTSGKAKSAAKGFTEDWKREYWKRWSGETAGYEKVAVGNLKQMFQAQDKDAVERLRRAEGPKDELLDADSMRGQYEEAMAQTLRNLVRRMVENAVALVPPKPAHRAKQLEELFDIAERWLGKHMLWAGEEISRETIEKLTASLAEGWRLGESIPDLADRVHDYFASTEDYRTIRIARTETISASNEASLIGYKGAFVERVEFFPAADACEEICLPLAGMILSIEAARGYITGSTHPQCRCVWLPVID